MMVGKEFPKFTNYIVAEPREGKAISVISDYSSENKTLSLL